MNAIITLIQEFDGNEYDALRNILVERDSSFEFYLPSYLIKRVSKSIQSAKELATSTLLSQFADGG